MDDNLNSVNAEVAEVVTPQNTEQSEETVETNNAEVVETQQETKVEQSKEENAKFAEQRRAREAAETKAANIERDYSIAKTYGKDYDVFSEVDIKEKFNMTLPEFKEAVRQQEMKDNGIDPDTVKKYADELPEVKEAREMKKYSQFAKEFPGVTQIPQEVWDAHNNGESLVEAYRKYDYKQKDTRIAELEAKLNAKETNAANASSSTGSVTGNGTSKDTTLTPEMIENMTDKERMSRWGEIKKVLGMK